MKLKVRKPDKKDILAIPKFEIIELWEIFKRYRCKRILDAGCGLNWFKKYSPKGTKVVGVDKWHEEADYKGDVQKLNFPSGSFDGVFCHHVIEHLENPFEALKEFHRVLQAGGILYVETPDPSSIWAKADETHLYAFSKEHLKRILKKAGFKVKEIWYQNVGMPGIRFLYRFGFIKAIPTPFSSVCAIAMKGKE
jgi:ubiquinone/menaquinone biosynthesis C-methylase UbiE